MLDAVATRLDATVWVVTGSTARALLGGPVRPRDIDVECADDALADAAERLGIQLAFDERDGRRSMRGSRSLRGVEVDLSSGWADVSALAPVWVTHGRRTIAVLSPEEAVSRAIAQGDARRLLRAVAEGPPGFSLDGASIAARLAALIAAR